MADIFLSYAEEDRDAARRIVGVLEGHGWTVWWDRRIPTGKTWRSVIEEGIRDMRCMVVLWSAHSIGSEWVNEEAEEGRVAGKLMPIMIERVKPPLGLRGIQATDLVDWDGSPDAAVIRQLISDITTMMQVAVPADNPANTTPAPQPKPSLQTHAPRLPRANQAMFRPGWAAALVVALAVPLVVILRPQRAPGDGANTPKPAIAAPNLTAPAAAPVAALPLPTALPSARSATPAVASSAVVQPSAATVPPGLPKPAAVEKTTLKPPVTQKAASPPAPDLPPVAKRTGKSKVDRSRCEAILQRAQLGATLTEEDKAFLKREC